MKWFRKLRKWFRKPRKWLKKTRKKLRNAPKSFVRSHIIKDRDDRCHRRRLFFEEIFSMLKIPIGYFTGIKGDDSWFNTCYHNMADKYDFYPFDRTYMINVGNVFSSDSHPQTYEFLTAKITRKSTILQMILSRSCVYNVYVDVSESGHQFNFSYEVKYSPRKKDSL